MKPQSTLSRRNRHARRAEIARTRNLKPIVIQRHTGRILMTAYLLWWVFMITGGVK